jgi:hypothetical protein
MCYFSRRHTDEEVNRVLLNPDPSEVPLLLKLSAISWTDGVNPGLHIMTVCTRAVQDGRPARGDTKETLMPLLKRAVTELPRPELPQDTELLEKTHFWALSIIADMGEPEAAVAILSPHVEYVEKKVADPKFAATFHISRWEWLLSAARKVERDEGKRSAYVAEARGMMGRAMRSLRGLRLEDWDDYVSDSTSKLRLRLAHCVADATTFWVCSSPDSARGSFTMGISCIYPSRSSPLAEKSADSRLPACS